MLEQIREYIRLGGPLCLITAAAAFLLAFGNYLTSATIERTQREAQISARSEAVKAYGSIVSESGREHEISGNTSVKSIHTYLLESGETVYIAYCEPDGYGGKIPVMVGIDVDMNIIEVIVMDVSTETPGLGNRVGEKSFSDKFTGKSGLIELVKHGGEGNRIDAVTGATVSSAAVTKGVNDALRAAEQVKRGIADE